VPGHPDIYLRKYNTAIFVHGCFWHRHEGCKYAYMPKSRVEFWEKKFESNKKRDSIVQAELQEKGFGYIIIWECTIRKMMKDDEFRENVMVYVKDFLKSNKKVEEI
jgi:DNA mismatch endonuclease (patch repair protein)